MATPLDKCFCECIPSVVFSHNQTNGKLFYFAIAQGATDRLWNTHTAVHYQGEFYN